MEVVPTCAARVTIVLAASRHSRASASSDSPRNRRGTTLSLRRVPQRTSPCSDPLPERHGYAFEHCATLRARPAVGGTRL